MTDSTLSAALKESYASATAGVVIYETLEITGSSFGAFRMCKNGLDLVACLESTAVYDASTYVTFYNYPFQIIPPSITENELPVLKLTIDNVNRSLSTIIQSAQAAGIIMSATYREFLSSDLSAPANNPPLSLAITKVTENDLTVTATAEFVNIANRRWPRNEYTTLQFPGLAY